MKTVYVEGPHTLQPVGIDAITYVIVRSRAQVKRRVAPMSMIVLVFYDGIANGHSIGLRARERRDWVCGGLRVIARRRRYQKGGLLTEVLARILCNVDPIIF